jgi:hypothetical protein
MRGRPSERKGAGVAEQPATVGARRELLAVGPASAPQARLPGQRQQALTVVAEVEIRTAAGAVTPGANLSPSAA